MWIIHKSHNKALTRPVPRCYYGLSPQDRPAGTFPAICYILSSKNPSVRVIIYRLDTCPLQLCTSLRWRKLPPIPDPRVLPCLTSCRPEFSVTFALRSAPNPAWNSHPHPTVILLVCFLFPLLTSIKHLLLSLSALYFPHGNINWWKLQEQKECLLLYPQWPINSTMSGIY